jgi:hypothetical protein
MCDRVDDGAIPDYELLWRRVHQTWTERDEAGEVRATSLAFIDRRSGEISVHRSGLTTEAFVLRNHPDDGIVELAASEPRALGYRLIADPVVGEAGRDADQSHAVLCPPAGAGTSRIKKLARTLAEQCRVRRAPHESLKRREGPNDGSDTPQ